MRTLRGVFRLVRVAYFGNVRIERKQRTTLIINLQKVRPEMNGRISSVERELQDAQERCKYWATRDCSLTTREMELRDLAIRDVERLEKTIREDKKGAQ